MNGLSKIWVSGICSMVLTQAIASAQVGPDSNNSSTVKPPIGDFDLDRHLDKHYGGRIIEEQKVKQVKYKV
jgi:hypothetical protein